MFMGAGQDICRLIAVVTYLGLARDEGMEKSMETTIVGYIRATIRIQSFILS